MGLKEWVERRIGGELTTPQSEVGASRFHAVFVSVGLRTFGAIDQGPLQNLKKNKGVDFKISWLAAWPVSLSFLAPQSW